MQLVGASNSSSYALYGFCKGIKDSKKDKLTIDEIKKAYNLIKDFDDATNNLYEFLGLNPRCNLQLIADKSTAQDMLEEMKEALLTVGI